MSAVSSVSRVMVVSAVLTCLASCSGGGSSTSSRGGGNGGTGTSGLTRVYVIQNPATFGSGIPTILQFSATASGSVSPTATISGPTNTAFNALATDGAGNIYASYYGPKDAGGVVEYAAGATGTATPIRRLSGDATTGVTAVDGLATSAAGEIFVGEDYGGVQAFSATASGSVAPSRWILGAYERGGGLSAIGTANSVAVDSSDNLYVVNQGYIGGQPLLVFGPTATGNAAPLYTIGGSVAGITVGSVNSVATDSSGNVYVTTGSASGGVILEFAAGAHGNVAPIRTISGPSTLLQALYGIKVDSAGNIYVVSATSTMSGINISPTILKFSATATGNVPPTSTFTSAAWTNPDNSRSLAIY